MDVKTPSEASKMLEAALQQMDGIISNASANNQNQQLGSNTLSKVTPKDNILDDFINSQIGNSSILKERSIISARNVLSTAKTLALALQQVGAMAAIPDPVTATIIFDWLDSHIARQDTDERMQRLQRENKSLALQYQMVADKVCEQADRIRVLEGLLSEKQQELSTKDELLQRQLCTRSELETQKLELMSALSELKLHRAALEKENRALKNYEMLSTEGPISKSTATFGSLGNLSQIANASEQSPKTPPFALRHQIHPLYHSLPRSQCHKKGNKPKLPTNPNHNNNNQLVNNNKQRNVVFASNEKILIEDVSVQNNSADLMSNTSTLNSNVNTTPSPTLKERSTKSLRHIFGILRRSNSGNLEIPPLEHVEPDFRRGDRARATAGGRIEWSMQTPNSSVYLNKDWSAWTESEIASWLSDMGLACYEEDCRKWLKNKSPNTFFNASPVEMEKELNMKSFLHRKKLKLAIDEITCKELDPLALKAGQLDIGWVMRWLDDIGLPQYKDSFSQAKVDGRMLHRLTMEDLTQLQVTSCLHIVSLRRGIQCMREAEWNPECLIRRSTKVSKETNVDSDDAKVEDVDTTTEHIALWTAHRVMEWLRVADLSEYAPNLRGAGVHGALMLYEPRFNANLLADLLSIPPSKTLLRRHLATHFKKLLGRDVIHAKREAEEKPGYQHLTITAKITPYKKTQFSLKRRKSTKGIQCGDTEFEWTDYVCPMVTVTSATASNENSNLTTTNLASCTKNS